MVTPPVRANATASAMTAAVAKVFAIAPGGFQGSVFHFCCQPPAAAAGAARLGVLARPVMPENARRGRPPSLTLPLVWGGNTEQLPDRSALDHRYLCRRYTYTTAPNAARTTPNAMISHIYRGRPPPPGSAGISVGTVEGVGPATGMAVGVGVGAAVAVGSGVAVGLGVAVGSGVTVGSGVAVGRGRGLGQWPWARA